ncbi:hypothetical protein GCM10027415_25840 [Humibacter ginsengisoli]
MEGRGIQKEEDHRPAATGSYTIVEHTADEDVELRWIPTDARRSPTNCSRRTKLGASCRG